MEEFIDAPDRGPIFGICPPGFEFIGRNTGEMGIEQGGCSEDIHAVDDLHEVNRIDQDRRFVLDRFGIEFGDPLDKFPGGANDKGTAVDETKVFFRHGGRGNEGG